MAIQFEHAHDSRAIVVNKVQNAHAQMRKQDRRGLKSPSLAKIAASKTDLYVNSFIVVKPVNIEILK